MDKISPIKENILQFIENQCIKKEDFYKKTGISASNLKGNGLRSEIGGAQIAKILSVYPEINPEWLLTGKGEMLRDNNHTVLEKPPAYYETEKGNINDIYIGIRIKEAREKCGLKSKDVAFQLKMDNSQYSKIENGKVMPTSNQMIALGKILDTSLDWLMLGKKHNIYSHEPIYKESYELALKNIKLQEENYKLREEVKKINNLGLKSGKDEEHPVFISSPKLEKPNN